MDSWTEFAVPEERSASKIGRAENEAIHPTRSAMMAKIGSRDTAPEMIVRRCLFSKGYRYRLHAGDLPGRPDIVFRKRRKAIFVHGCFWHRHDGCPRTTTPKTRQSYWLDKFERNQARDARNEAALSAMGWNILIIWECETKEIESLSARLKAFMEA